ncbi:MAG TPA: hypothetical protein VGE74_09990 [Gemmata sp.]
MTRRLWYLAGAVLFAPLVAVPVPGAAPAGAAEPGPCPDPVLSGSCVTALLEANDGKPPATGAELWQVLGKLGTFAQLPVVFSAVRLDSGISNPRVVIAPVASAPGGAEPTAVNLNGRLFLAANMEKAPAGGDPKVTSVEFISWNELRRRFDFGVIEDIGTDAPKLRLVDGGRCFSCHKNRGPILGAGPWTNSTAHTGLRTLVANKYKLVDVVPPGAVGVRDRIDGMALVAPEGAAVDEAVRLGGTLKLNRERFRLMNRSPGGRQAFVALLGAIAQPGPLAPNDRATRTAVDRWGADPSYLRYTREWLALAKATNHGVLADFAPFPIPLYESWDPNTIKPLPPPPAVRTRSSLDRYQRSVLNIQLNNELAAKNIATKLQQLADIDAARANGRLAVPSASQPSNIKAFVQLTPKATQKPSGLVNPVLLANTMGLTEGDRAFVAGALAGAAKRLNRPQVTPAVLAKAVFEEPQFADVLAGDPLPDRDDFKDRFVAGLDALLTTKYRLADGFAPERATYGRVPKRDPKALEELEAAVVPTSACLRCHDVRAGAKPRLFETIPALPFDPFDTKGRADWVRTADPKRKQEVLARLQARVHTDADMPPNDAPEYETFRVKGAAAFDDLKRFIEAELVAPKKP